MREDNNGGVMDLGFWGSGFLDLGFLDFLDFLGFLGLGTGRKGGMVTGMVAKAVPSRLES